MGVEVQRYWAHLAGAITFFLGMLGLQIGRVASDTSTWQDVVVQTVVGVVVVGGVVGIVIGSFWVRGAPASERRRKIATVSGVTWLADVLVDVDAAEALGISTPAPLRPRTYALTSTSQGLGLWGTADDDSAAVNIPFERIEGANAPMADFAETAGQFLIELAKREELDLSLSNPVLWGMYPATPNQVEQIVEKINGLVDSSSNAS